MIIKRIFIKDLFGIPGNNRNMEFNDDLTIMVGKNGAGKTTTLNIINSIINQKFQKLFKHKFTSIEAYFIENKIEILNEGSKTLRIIHTLPSNKEEKITIVKGSDKPIKNLSYKLETLYFPTYRRLETDLMALLTDSLELDDNLYSYSYSAKRAIGELPYISQNISDTVLGLTHKDITTIIEKKWNEVNEFEKKELNNVINGFLLSLLEPESNKLWNTSFEFNPNQVKRELQQMFKQVGIISSEDETKRDLILDYVDKVEWAHIRLNENRSDDDKNKQRKKHNNNRDVEDLSKAIEITLSYTRIDQLLTRYRETFNTITEKRKPFRDLVNTLNEFLDIDVEIIKGKMYFVKDGTLLNFEDLSAGEKQLVALFVYTKVHLKKNTIVIIDEPELSLHINWQRKFLKHLTEGDSQIQYIVSTHSPFIISNFQSRVHKLADIGYTEGEVFLTHE